MRRVGRKEIGTWGEEKAAHFLEQKGYTILHKNVFLKCGEIDIVARTPESDLSFVEVKTRVNAPDGYAERAIDQRKTRNLFSAAQLFCLQNEVNLNYTSIRFEHISVCVNTHTKSIRFKKYFLPIEYGHI